MELTTEILTKYVGGQIEEQNAAEGLLLRGEIDHIRLEGNIIIGRYTWLKKGLGFPPIPKKWAFQANLDFAIGIRRAKITDIGKGRISILSSITGSLFVFFPPGYNED